MLGSVAFRSPALESCRAFALEAAGADLSSRTSRLPPRSTVVCDAQRRHASIPKLEPFSRSRIERGVKEPPFLQKTENDLTDYCSTLEGDESYSCWRAYFELKDLEQELPREDVEKFVRQSGGTKSLIDCLHGITAMQKKKEKEIQHHTPIKPEAQNERCCPIPDGLPPTAEELEEAEKARMPDSPFTRLLRSKGRLPAWYSQAPDHEAT
ncbi:CCG-binding protein 1 [Canna indica]|uniref:CCG-binding protein 1 n=1 Tax=Canna indica TaxID=4628 RepID=A0AAQ3K5N2_9LILI|nr:CCG-binding protein 1 [Canna indica]